MAVSLSSSLYVGAEQNLDLSQAYVIYSNLFITGRTNYLMSIGLTLKGSYNQTGWLVLNSPWKPLLVISNNTDKPFVELTYNSRMTTNPISTTSEIFAWDYDSTNNVVFIKFLSSFTVKVSVHFGVPNVSGFSPSKSVYSPSEAVEVFINVYGNYSALLSMNWIAKVAVKDIVNNTVKTMEQEFQLAQSETKQLRFALGTFEMGTYTAIAQTVDPRTGYTLVTNQLTFEVKTLQTQPTIPPWALWILLATGTISVVAVNKLYHQRKRRLNRKVLSLHSFCGFKYLTSCSTSRFVVQK